MTMIDGASIGYWKAHAPSPDAAAALNTLTNFNASHLKADNTPSNVLTKGDLLATQTTNPGAVGAMDAVNRERQQVSAAEEACRTLVAEARGGGLRNVDADTQREIRSQIQKFQKVVDAEAKSGHEALKTMDAVRNAGVEADFRADFGVETHRQEEVRNIVDAQTQSPYLVTDTDGYAQNKVAPLLDKTRHDMQAVMDHLGGSADKNAALINLTHDLEDLSDTQKTLQQDGTAAGNMQNLGGALQTQAAQHMTWGFNQLNQLEPLMREATHAQHQGVIDVAITHTPNLPELRNSALSAINRVHSTGKSVMDPSMAGLETQELNAITPVQQALASVTDPTSGRPMLEGDLYTSNAALEGLVMNSSLQWSR
ncbi:hypothetical protein [Ralstonia pickettii]|uniref:hypothetical protein n=1 Tax=Ralstonia pickettii TaxID=329 RepID=UPI00081894D6|nr:hypothetical protein [Ralstonia pickettii]OCS49756.1 hypothetical protein BEK67_18115 [Ralstonia pickettii]